jgi:hypothetical protein
MASRRRGLNPAFDLGQRIQDIENYPLRSSAVPPPEEDVVGGPQPSIFDPVNLIKTDTYYQAPTMSSRLAGFQFVPLQSRFLSMNQFEEALSSNTNIEGYLYVWWVKGTNVSRYGPLSLSEYEDFKNQKSYGQAILTLPGYIFDVGNVGG